MSSSKLRQLGLLMNVKKKMDAVFCIYKPTGMYTYTVLNILKKRIAEDFNKLPVFPSELKRPTQDYLAEATNTSIADPNQDSLPASYENNLWKLPTSINMNKLQHLNLKLVYGDIVMRDDIDIRYVDPLAPHSSGVVLFSMGFRHGRPALRMIENAKYLRVYHVKARLGLATDNFYYDGKFIERTTYSHVTKEKLDKVCSSAQSAHQRLMFECVGVNPKSQEAYDLACRGIIRPMNEKTRPILYGIKCIYFNPPEFTLEIHSINETCNFLAQFVSDIGWKLKTNAVCTHIHRLRYGYFNLNDTLLFKNWTVPDILKNMYSCEKHLTNNKLFVGSSIKSDGDSQQRMPEYKICSGEGPSAREIIDANFTDNKLYKSEAALNSKGQV